MRRILLQVQVFVFLVCFGLPATGLLAQPTPPGRDQAKISKKAIESADLSVLFIGNSHSRPIPSLLKKIYKKNNPKMKTFFVAAGGFGFLVDHANSPRTVNLLKKGKWDYVVLQAQKYSTTGRYKYPIDGALKLSEIAKKQGTKVIMYPEWSRRVAPDEYKRINKLHESIAAKTGAQVAPIGQSWAAAEKTPIKLKLLARDGNHATIFGSYLNACVFYGMLSGKKVEKPSDLGRMRYSEKDLLTLHEESWKQVEQKNNKGKAKKDSKS